jgi:hypothetical protein
VGVELPPPPQASRKPAAANAVTDTLNGKACAGLSSIFDTTSVMQASNAKHCGRTIGVRATLIFLLRGMNAEGGLLE